MRIGQRSSLLSKMETRCIMSHGVMLCAGLPPRPRLTWAHPADARVWQGSYVFGCQTRRAASQSGLQEPLQIQIHSMSNDQMAPCF